MDDATLLSASPIPLATLHTLLSSGGRPAILNALRAAGVPLNNRQKIATAAARAQRSADAPESRPMAPQPSMPPLSIRAEGGLCNKLRVILSYRLAAMDEGRHLIVVWANGGPCPALWEDLFEPLAGVTVVSTDSPSLRAALAPMSLEECAVPSEFGTHPRIAGTPREAQMYSLLRPKPSILRSIEDAIARCKDGSDDGRFLAMHIRRTDYTTTFGLSTPDHAFENFLEMHLVNGSSSSSSKSTARALIRPRAGDEAATTAAMASCAYLATDNGETQQHFQSLFGDERIRTHIAINTMRHTETLRHTTVADAVVDLYTCAAAYVFKGTLGSSFSDTIWLMRKARGSSNEHDELESDDSFQRRIAKHSRSTVRPGECGLLIDLPLPKEMLQEMAAQAPSKGEAAQAPLEVEPPPFAWMLESVFPSSSRLSSNVLAAAASFLDNGLSPPDVPDALCSTHWLPLAPKTWPCDGIDPRRPLRHALEAAVLRVASAASRADLPLLRGRTIVGLEWWLQEQWPGDLAKEWHTDKAVGKVRHNKAATKANACVDISDSAVDDEGVVTRHPLVSSVLYLCDCGGPTAVFGSQTASIDEMMMMASSSAAADAAGAITVSLGFPTKGSLLLFDGALLHGVLQTPPPPLGCEPTEEAPRRTLLVNFWVDDCPPGAIDAPLPTLPVFEEDEEEEATVGTKPRCAAGCLQRLEAPFERDAERWLSQRLPEALVPEVSPPFARFQYGCTN